MRFNPLPSTAQQTHKLRQSIQNLQIVEGPGARIGQTLRSVSRGTQSQDWSNTQVSQQRNLELGLVKHSGQLIAEPRARIGQTLWSVSRGTQSQDWSNTHVSQQRNLELGLVKHSGQLVKEPRARIGITLRSAIRETQSYDWSNTGQLLEGPRARTGQFEIPFLSVCSCSSVFKLYWSVYFCLVQFKILLNHHPPSSSYFSNTFLPKKLSSVFT